MRHSCANMRRAVFCSLAAILSAISSTTWAQAFPSRPVTLVVPFAAGGPLDIMSRAVSREVEKTWKQPVIIESRAGAGGMVGSDYVTRQKADGYTLLLHGPAPLQIRMFMKEPSFNPADLRPLVALGESSYMATVHPGLGVKTMKELVDLAKSKPNELNYATIPMSTYDLGYHLFMQQVGIKMNAIPYQSAAPIIPAFLRGDIQVYFGTLTTLGPHLASGKLTPIAWLYRERHPKYPNVPTAREQGFEYSTSYVNGLFVHAKTPEDLFHKLGRDIAATLKVPEVIAQLDVAGYLVPPTPLDWGTQIQSETARYMEMARMLNYKPE